MYVKYTTRILNISYYNYYCGLLSVIVIFSLYSGGGILKRNVSSYILPHVFCQLKAAPQRRAKKKKPRKRKMRKSPRQRR